MKIKPMLLVAALMLAGRAFAQEAAPAPAPAPAPTLVPGDEVKTDALAKGDWIQGAPLTAWEPGKVYMLECWATWCGPCIAALPHINEKHKKYSEKGLRVIGVNVREDGKEKVANFVKGKGEGMSYPVVYTGKGGDFEKEWMKASGARGIPHAFLVRDGKLLLHEHPALINDEILLAALDGGEDAFAKVQEAMRKVEAEMAALKALVNEFLMAARNKDIPAMEAALVKVKESDKADRYASTLELQILLAKGDWESIGKLLEQEEVDPNIVKLLAQVASSIDNMPQPLVESVAAKYIAIYQGKPAPLEMQVISRLQWKLGKKEDALASARSALEKARIVQAKQAKFPVVPFEKFAAAVEEGGMPTNAEFKGWMQEAMPKRAAP